MTTVAHSTELERLIAEQAADDTERIFQREHSLDAPVGDDGRGSLYEIVSGRLAARAAVKVRGRVTAEQRKEWRNLRSRGWTCQEIANYAGVAVGTVQVHVPRTTRRKGKGRNRPPNTKKAALRKRESYIRETYVGGARMRDIADVLWRETGFESSAACYQAVRELLHEWKVPIRPPSWKHGERMQAASVETRNAYQRRIQRRRRREQGRVRRCSVIDADGQRCRLWAAHGGEICRNHLAPRKWTRHTVCAALTEWAAVNGRNPCPKDWIKASEGRPTHRTVYDLFDSWPAALAEAGLQPRVRSEDELRGLTVKQRDILLVLDEESFHEPITVSALSSTLAERGREWDWIGWDAGGVHGTLQRLQARGFARRIRLERTSLWTTKVEDGSPPV